MIFMKEYIISSIDKQDHDGFVFYHLFDSVEYSLLIDHILTR